MSKTSIKKVVRHDHQKTPDFAAKLRGRYLCKLPSTAFIFCVIQWEGTTARGTGGKPDVVKY